MLHDVGKIGIPDALLTKPGSLTPDERHTMQRHCELGHQLLSGSDSSLLSLAASIALTHHERWDGAGYPRGLARDAIPLEGRVVAIADVFDAITSARVYRPAMTMKDALATIERGSGSAFDPALIELFFGSVSEFIDIRDQHPDVDGPPTRIRVLVVDDQELFAQGMVRLLETADDLSVVGCAASVHEALEVAEDEEPDVVVLDWRLPDGTGADAARGLLEARPSTKIVILTGLVDDGVLAEALDAGCAAVLTKGRAFEEIVLAIRAAYAGEVTIPLAKLSSIVDRLASRRPAVGTDLTPRELEILHKLGEGLSNEAIAELLTLSLFTVRNHVQRIIMKMEAHSKLEAVTRGLREGVIQMPPRYSAL
jgi:response regulator RpfG family c-di-GMP phosphodiesterase